MRALYPVLLPGPKPAIQGAPKSGWVLQHHAGPCTSPRHHGPGQQEGERQAGDRPGPVLDRQGDAQQGDRRAARRGLEGDGSSGSVGANGRPLASRQAGKKKRRSVTSVGASLSTSICMAPKRPSSARTKPRRGDEEISGTSFIWPMPDSLGKPRGSSSITSEKMSGDLPRTSLTRSRMSRTASDRPGTAATSAGSRGRPGHAATLLAAHGRMP